jgi:arsenite-transporting ATPase
MQREVVGLKELDQLSRHIYGDQDPIPPLATEQPLRFYMEGDRYILALRVTGLSGGAVDLEKEGEELRVRLGRFRRSLILPQYLAGLDPVWAQVEDSHLKIAFVEPKHKA